jgi:hypothetical protein
MRAHEINGEIKVNIGCGLSGISRSNNLDNSPTITLSRIPVLNRLLKTPAWPRDVRRYDVRKVSRSETAACATFTPRTPLNT